MAQISVSQKMADTALTRVIALNAPFSSKELIVDCGFAPKTAWRLIQLWVSQNTIEPAGSGARLKPYYRVTKVRKQLHAQSDLPSKQQNMWTAMRRCSRFIAPDIVGLATTRDLSVSASEVTRYSRKLVSAGYLRVMPLARSIHSETAFKVIRDLGPLAPHPIQLASVFDPNSKSFTHIAGVHHEV